MANTRRFAAQRAEQKIISQGPQQPKQRRERRGVYRALLGFADSRKGTWPPTAGSAEYREALRIHVLPLGLKRTLQSGKQVTHDASSLARAIGDLLKGVEDAEDRSLHSFFQKGSSVFNKKDFLAKFSYSDESTTNVVINSDRRDVEDLREPPSEPSPQPDGNGQGDLPEPKDSRQQDRMESWTGFRVSGGDDMATQHLSLPHSVGDRPDLPPAQTVRVEIPTQSCLQTAGSKIPLPQTKGSAASGSRTPSSTSRAEGLSPAVERPRLLLGGKSPQPYLGTFAVPGKDIKDTLRTVFDAIESSLQDEFSAADLQLSDPADFELHPTSELQKVYETLFGTKAWKENAIVLLANRPPRAFDTCFAVVAAAVHLWVFDTVQPWQGPLHENFGSQLHRTHVARTILRHTGFELDELLHIAAQSEVQDSEFMDAEILPRARQLATDLAIVLPQHLGRLRARASPHASLPFGEGWRVHMVDVFAHALHLAERLRVATAHYEFCWYGSGEQFNPMGMVGRYPASRGERVAMTMFPGVELFVPQTGKVQIAKAVVIATDTRRGVGVERLSVGQGC